jgi:tight adherence protein B
MVIAVAALAVGLGLPLVALPVIAAAAAAAGGLIRRARARKRSQAAARLVPDVAFALAAELRAGRSPPDALAMVLAEPALADATATATATATLQHGRASSVRRADLHPDVSRHRLQPLDQVFAVWELADTGGVAVADVLDRLGDAIAEGLSDAEQLDAAMAGPRTTAWLLTGLPALGIGLGEAVGADPLRLLVHGSIGWGLCAGAAALDLAGWGWTRRILRRATS